MLHCLPLRLAGYKYCKSSNTSVLSYCNVAFQPQLRCPACHSSLQVKLEFQLSKVQDCPGLDTIVLHTLSAISSNRAVQGRLQQLLLMHLLLQAHQQGSERAKCSIKFGLDAMAEQMLQHKSVDQW